MGNQKIRNLKEMLEITKDRYADNIAYKIRNEDKSYTCITHKQTRDMIDYLGTALIDIGLKDKRIGIISENCYQWEIAYLSIVCGAGVVVPLDKSLPENELKSLIERSQIEAIFFSKKYENILKEVKLKAIGKLKHLISMDLFENKNGIYSQKELIEKGEKLVKSGDTRFINANIDNEKMSIMLFTSGTTSKSKIVGLSHRNLCSNLMDIDTVLDVDSNDIFLSFLPLHHVFECTVGFLFSLYKGSQTVFCDGIRHIIENLNEYQVSVMTSVPAIYERIFNIIGKQLEKKGKRQAIILKEEKYKDESMERKKEIFKEIHEMLGGKLKLLISGAASLDIKIEEKYRKLGLNLVQGYGLTETSPVIAVGSNKEYKLGSVGKALPNVDVKLVNCDKDNIGELIVKGPNIMLGYFENEKETKKAIKDGWFYTGDLAKIDEQGYIYICGRKKSVIVLKNGKNIFPEEMENLINRIEGIEESFVFGKQVSEYREDIKIFAKIVYNAKIIEQVYKVNGKEQIYSEINKKIKEINKTMPPYKAIRGIIFSQEPLIKTTTNKIKRQENLNAIMKEESNNGKK